MVCGRRPQAAPARRRATADAGALVPGAAGADPRPHRGDRARDRVAEAARNGPIVTPLTEWKLEHPIGRGGCMLVHTADCRLASGRTRPTTREQALDALRQPQVETWSICPAAQELGITDR
ncbi:DUF6233 domain-containing protein [Streptomyces goshikiensis]|uniref:DUF6233 domain-containing protein n=1 Tax=Streptomyces TaxID=1883 RepID=UPI002279C435|nr:DUF6233 domain-containing protein [Streptomyces sp. CB02120-2]